MGITVDIVGGFALLFVGAEVLVRGASRLAALLGIPSVVIGLTVVAFGTSAPELAVSVMSSARGASGLAVGNVVGSNIFNVLAILGLVALIQPLSIVSRVVWRDVPVMIVVSLVAVAVAWDTRVTKLEGALLVAGLALFLLSMRGAENGGDDSAEKPARGGVAGVSTQIATVAVGLFLLVYGSRWLVSGATELARLFGLSELLIGLTLVAAGTSLPELATSFVAAIRKEQDIAVGNVVGSNVFNILGVLGIAGLVSPSPIDVPRSSLRSDFPVMIGAAVLCMVFFHSGRRLSRSEGAFFLVCFVLYTAYLFLAGTGRAPSGNSALVVLGAVSAGLVWVLWQNRRG
jgi:cation:H+ antiporter